MGELLRCLLRGEWRRLLAEETENGWIRLFRYGLVGGGAFAIDFAVYCLLVAWGMQYLLAGVAAFAVSFLFNFGMSRKLVFASAAKGAPGAGELAGTLAVSLLGLLFTEALLYFGVEALRLSYGLSKALASLLVLFWNYFARKAFIYRR